MGIEGIDTVADILVFFTMIARMFGINFRGGHGQGPQGQNPGGPSVLHPESEDERTLLEALAQLQSEGKPEEVQFLRGFFKYLVEHDGGQMYIRLRETLGNCKSGEEAKLLENILKACEVDAKKLFKGSSGDTISAQDLEKTYEKLAADLEALLIQRAKIFLSRPLKVVLKHHHEAQAATSNVLTNVFSQASGGTRKVRRKP